MMIMAQHPQNQSNQRHQQAPQGKQQPSSHHDAGGSGAKHFRDKTITAQHFVAVMPAATALKLQKQIKASDNQQATSRPLSEQLPINEIFKQTTSAINRQNKSKHLQKNDIQTHPEYQNPHISEKQHQDGKRTLMKNQLYLIEQLQLENANLRNERDQLQLENEELKFQLQMISSSNILTHSGRAFSSNPHQHQLDAETNDSGALVGGDSRMTTTNSSDMMMTTAAASIANRFPASRGSNDSQQSGIETVVTSTSALARVALRQPVCALNGLFADDQLRSSQSSSDNINGAGDCRRAISSGDLAITSQQQRKLANVVAKTSALKQPSATETNHKFLSAKSSSLASFNVSNLTKTLQGAMNYVPNPKGSTTLVLDANQDTDDSERALRLVCQRLNIGDSEKVVAAAVIIQRACRNHQIGKRFRIITEQLRHACKSSSQVTTGNGSLGGGGKTKQDRTTTNVHFASGTTRAAAWESLSYAASQLANAAAEKQKQQQQQQQQTATKTTVTKSNSCQQVNRPIKSTITDCNSHQAQTRSTSAFPSLVTQPQSNISNTVAAAATQMKSSDPSVVAAALNFQQLESMRKRQYRVGLNIFNKSPEKGVSFLIAHSFIDCSSPFTKSPTSYYLANQLHCIDKQNLAQQSINGQNQQQRSHDYSAINSRNQNQNLQQTNCQFCHEEENLKRNIAHFLLNRKGLAKEKIGQYLGNLQSQFNQDVLRYYLQELDFSGMQIDTALRKFSSTLRMPGEAQKIERFVDYFAQRYVQCQQQQQQQQQFGSINISSTNLAQQAANSGNPTPLKSCSTRGVTNKQQEQQNLNDNNRNSHLTLLSKDEIFILTFAIIMLNTDLHSPSLKSQSRMSGQQFINNLRGVFKSQTINENDLLDIYERVKANQINTAPDHVTHVLKVQQGLTVNNFQKRDSIPNLCVPHRRLVCFCRLFEVYDVNKKERVGQHQREIFLFNDMLLVTKLARRTRTNSQQYTFRQSIPLHGLYVQLFQSAHYNFGLRLCRWSNDETLIMFNARNELDQSRFVDDLSESIAEMEEMEAIRVHNMIETIHFKHQERLKRHAIMHEMQSMNNEQRDQFEVSDKLSRGFSVVNFEARKKVASSEKLIIPESEENEIASKVRDDKENVTSVSPVRVELPPIEKKPRRLQSKFSSMSNLSSVSEGMQDNDEGNNIASGDSAKSSGQNSADGDPPSSGLSLNRTIIQSDGTVKLGGTNATAGQIAATRQHQRAAGQMASRMKGNQRSCSTASVHSLDSGLFLSRDVSPNQSG